MFTTEPENRRKSCRSLKSFYRARFTGEKKGPFDECESLKGPKKIPGIVLLSHSQLYSTIAAGALNYRVREGNVCVCSAMDTGKNHNEESLEGKLA